MLDCLECAPHLQTFCILIHAHWVVLTVAQYSRVEKWSTLYKHWQSSHCTLVPIQSGLQMWYKYFASYCLHKKLVKIIVFKQNYLSSTKRSNIFILSRNTVILYVCILPKCSLVNYSGIQYFPPKQH